MPARTRRTGSEDPMPPQRPRLMIFLATALALAGCGPSGAGAGKAAVESAPATAKAPPAGSMPTRAEAIAFAREAEQAVAAHDLDAFAALVDWDALFKSATAIPGAKPALREAFAGGVRKTINRDEG